MYPDRAARAVVVFKSWRPELGWFCQPLLLKYALHRKSSQRCG